MFVSPFTVVLFDLDGTLVDTAPDLGFALNTLLEQEGRQTIDHARIRPVASHGSAGLLNLGFGIEKDDPAYPALQQRFLTLYAENIARESALFIGMQDVLDTLAANGIRWGVVTNKPSFLTMPLMEALQLTQSAACIVSADTTPHSKPHPAPMLHACELVDTKPMECIYIGDAERDIQAARNAQMRSVVALYGYISETDTPESWQADCAINHPYEILQWI